MLSLEDHLKLDWKNVTEVITGFIKGMVAGSGAKGVAVGLSGGIDSTVVAYLSARALGKDSVYGLIMPDSSVTPEEDVKDVEDIATNLRIKYWYRDISDIVEVYEKSESNFFVQDKVAIGNLRARIRMSLLYYMANSRNLLVIGTGDRSEILIGYFTKYGDGGVDFLPIGDLYKTQVRWLGRWLGVPEHIVKKPSSPQLWKGHKAEEEIGISYNKVDLILHALFDLRMEAQEVKALFGKDVDKILELHSKSAHKRAMPPVARVRI